ncbi:MAG: glycosyltransferase [Actinobacteria bacterium]|nr:glycosyltransferase [Actinomycetota bacterium]
MSEARGRFSVIIPTLQRSKHLRPLVDQCAAHPLVQEVLVINNANAQLTWDSPKVRVLDQAQNIYVNPAWNLGAREASGEYLAIVNDDLLFEDEALEESASILARGFYGLVIPDSSCFHEVGPGSIAHRPAPYPNDFFGTFMCMRRRDYWPVPDDMLIWGGDDWLFLAAKRLPAALIRTRFATEMHTTSGGAEFDGIRRDNWAASRQRLGSKHPEGVGRGSVPHRAWHVLRRPYAMLQTAWRRWRRQGQ